MWNKELLEKINKDDLIRICDLDCKKTEKKDIIIDLAYTKIENNEILGATLNKQCGNKIALHPTKMEEILGITKTERKRWEDKFNIRYYDSFNKYGKKFEYPMYDYFSIINTSQESIKKWRDEHSNQVSINRKAGTSKAQKTKNENKKKVQNFYNNEWISMIKEWKSIDLELANTYQLAFWTMWVNRTAKYFQEKAVNAKLHNNLYTQKKENFYKLKNEAIELLSKSKYCNIYFYRPENADKLYVNFCDIHYEFWCMERIGMLMDKWDYYYLNEKEINKCKYCNVNIKKDYYSLYYMDISSDKLPEYNFSFHTPYPIGQNFFGSPEHYKMVEHEENLEGLFRFGRSLNEDDIVVFTENKVIKYFEESKQSFIDYYKRKELIKVL